MTMLPATRELETRISHIASRMVLQHPFIAAVFTRLERIYWEKDAQFAAATNGHQVFYDVERMATFTDEELLFVCMHETLHVVFLHNWRGEGYNHQVAGIAMDAVINLALDEAGVPFDRADFQIIRIPWVTRDMDWETVYHHLLQEAKQRAGQSPKGKGQGQQGKGKDKGQGEEDPSEGEVSGSPEHPTTSASNMYPNDLQGDVMAPTGEVSEADVEAGTITAAKMAKACGSNSSLVQRVLDGLPPASVPWYEETRDLLKSYSRNDYSYRRFNRNLYSAIGAIVPTLYSPAMGPLLIGFDTSGSVGQAEANQIGGEITAIAAELMPEAVVVVYCDTKIAGEQRFEQGEEVVIKPKGGGGTRFKPVFDYAIENAGQGFEAVIYFTDLWGNVDECPDPGIPVIWACTDRNKRHTKVPFGRVLEVVL